MEVLFNWLVDNIVMWIVCGIFAYNGIRAITHQKMMQGIVLLFLAGFSYYTLKNPTVPLEWVANNIIAKIFGK